MKTECERNIISLSKIIESLGGQAPGYSRDFTGFLMQGYTAIRGLSGDEGILRALRTDMHLILGAYEKTLKLSLPDNLRSSVKNALKKIKKHRESIEVLLGI